MIQVKSSSRINDNQSRQSIPEMIITDDHVEVSMMQLDSCVLNVSSIKEEILACKLFKTPKINLQYRKYGGNIYMIGYIFLHTIQLNVNIEIVQDDKSNYLSRWISIYDNVFQEIISIRSEDASVNHLKYQLPENICLIPNKSILLQHPHQFLNTLRKHTLLLIDCIGIKFPVEKQNLSLLNSFVFNSCIFPIGDRHPTKIINHEVNENEIISFISNVPNSNLIQKCIKCRIDWSFNIYLSDRPQNHVIFISNLDSGQHFPNYYSSSFVKDRLLNHLKVVKSAIYKYQFGIFSGNTFKFKILNGNEISGEILYYYNNTLHYRNAPENKVKSISIFQKLRLERHLDIFSGSGVTLEKKVSFFRIFSRSLMIQPRVEVRCFHSKMTKALFKYFTYLYNNYTLRIPIKKMEINTDYFKKLTKKISHRLLYCKTLKESFILEEILTILFNGYNEQNSIISKSASKEIFSALLERKNWQEFDNVICKPANTTLRGLGYNFIDKEIDHFIFNFLQFEDQITNEPVEENPKPLKKVFKEFIFEVVERVFFPQLILDILVHFENNTLENSLHDWDTVNVLDKYQFKIKSKRLLTNTLENFLMVARANLMERHGVVNFPQEFHGNHSLRVRERDNRIRSTLIEWIECLVTYYTNDSIKLSNSSRKMFLFLFHYVEYYQNEYNINLSKLLYYALMKYNFNQLPELGGGIKILKEIAKQSTAQFITKLHTSSNGKSSNYFIWINIYERKVEYTCKEHELISGAVNRHNLINEVYLRAIEKLPTIIKKYYIPDLNDDDIKVKEYLKDNGILLNNQFLTDVFENRKIYRHHRKDIDHCFINWNLKQCQGLGFRV
jgi:hypothetical protein